MWQRILIALCIGLAATPAIAQQPPGTGGYTFQGQGNLAQALSGLANPLYGQVGFGTKLGGYSLIQPFGDITESSTVLGKFNVSGLHLNAQVCSSSPCSVTQPIVNCNASSGGILLQLPGAAGSGFVTVIQKTDTTNNACQVTAAGSDTINNLSSIPISTPFQPMMLIDSQQGAWFSGLLTLATGSSSGGTFPLLSDGDFNNFSGLNAGGFQLVQQAAPSGLSATATCTGTCATTYTYEVSCLTAFGESPLLPNNVANTTTATNAATLTTANNNSVNWTFQPQCRAGYNVYGRVGGALGRLTTLPQTATTWTDDGSIANPFNSYTFTFASAAYPAVQVWDLQGANSTAPIDVIAAASGLTRTLSVPAVTTTATHDLQVTAWAFDKAAGAWTGPGSFTTTTTVAANTVTNYGLGMAARDRASAATTGTSTSTTAVLNYFASQNITIKAANPAVAITVGNTPTFTAASPYTSVTFGDPTGTATGDVELVCVSFLTGTSIAPPVAPANFQLISAVISQTTHVQLNCYWNTPTVSGGTPPPVQNTTGSFRQLASNGVTYSENLIGLTQITADSANLPNGAASNAIMKSYSFPVTMTVQNCRGTWTGLSGCSPFPTFAWKDTTAGNVICSSGVTTGSATDGFLAVSNLTIPANDVLSFLATTNGASCTAGQTTVTMVLHQ